MELILKLLSLLAFLFLFAGMIAPNIISFISKKPNRMQIFVIWLLMFILIWVLYKVLIGDDAGIHDNLTRAENYIESAQYEDAIKILQGIDKKSDYYHESALLLNKADSLMKVQKTEQAEQERLKTIAANEKKNYDDLQSLKTLTEQLKKGYDFSAFRGSYEDLNLEIELLKKWQLMVNNASYGRPADMTETGEQLGKLLISIQKKEFPLIRREYGKVAKNKLWEHDIIVEVTGTNNTIINFTGGLFAANKNKKDIYTELYDVLYKYRFKQLRFRWYKGADEYEYYTIFEGKDSDPVN